MTDYDAYAPVPRPPLRWGRVALLAGAGALLAAGIASAQQGAAVWSLEFVACAGRDCRAVQIPWGGSLMQCQLYGQHLIAAWQRDHPGMTVPNGYRCTSEREA